MENSYTSGREGEFKDDIKPRSSQGLGFDIRDSRVRMHSIGWLDDNYLDRRGILQPGYISEGFTRIPPLSTLPGLLDHKTLRSSAYKAIGFTAAEVLAVLSAVYGLLHSTTVSARSIAVSRMPKSYSYERGVYVDWKSFFNQVLKSAIPIMLVFCLVALFAILNNTGTVQPSPQTNGGYRSSGPMANKPIYVSPSSSSNSNGPSGSVSESSAASSPNPTSSSAPGYYLGPSSTTSSSTGSSTGAAASTPSNTASSSSYSAPSSSSSTSSTPSSSASSGSSSSSGSLLPLNVTAPAVNTSLSGKTLVNTTPVTLTVN